MNDDEYLEIYSKFWKKWMLDQIKNNGTELI